MRYLILLSLLAACDFTNERRANCFNACTRAYERAHVTDAMSPSICADYEICREECLRIS